MKRFFYLLLKKPFQKKGYSNYLKRVQEVKIGIQALKLNIKKVNRKFDEILNSNNNNKRNMPMIGKKTRHK